MLYGNNAETSYTYYDGNFRLKTLDTYDGQGIQIQDLEYTYYDVGNLWTIEDDLNEERPDHIFEYDNINRLTVASTTGGSDPSRSYEQIFIYDLAGNIEKKTGIGGYTVIEWEDQYTHIKPKAVNFDDEVAGIASRNIEYNQENKPTEITYAGGTTTYHSYDGEGNRVKKVQGSNAVVYVGDIYEVREGEALSYIYANGKKIATLTDDHEYYTHADHLGSTSLTTDENGEAIEEIGYLPFGAVLFRNVYNGSTWESAYKFTGQEHDSEFELYNYNARLYDPVMGRFITPDPIVPEPFNPQSLNRYAYCLNNPLIYTDPSGYWWGSDLWNWFTNWFQDTNVTVDPTIIQNSEYEFTMREITVTAEKLKTQQNKIDSFNYMMPGSYFHPYPRINISRFAYTDKSTISRFSIEGTFIKGYFLEPAKGTDKEARTEGSSKAIPAGTYLAIPYNTSPGLGNKGKIMQLLCVPGRTLILIHIGNEPKINGKGDTTGCLVPGENWRKDYVGPSKDLLNQIMEYTGRYAIINIQDAPWSAWR